MFKKIFFSLLAIYSCAAHAEPMTIHADITFQDECPDYSMYDSRALITESKKLHNDVFVYTLGQLPCALLSVLSAAGAITIVAKTISGDWHPLCNIGAVGLGATFPFFAALFVELENKKILARFNKEEINKILTPTAYKMY